MGGDVGTVSFQELVVSEWRQSGAGPREAVKGFGLNSLCPASRRLLGQKLPWPHSPTGPRGPHGLGGDGRGGELLGSRLRALRTDQYQPDTGNNLVPNCVRGSEPLFASQIQVFAEPTTFSSRFLGSRSLSL